MASNPLHHDQPAYLHVLRMYMSMLDAVGVNTQYPSATQQLHMWRDFMEDIGAGYNQHHQLEVKDTQRFLVACLRYNIPT